MLQSGVLKLKKKKKKKSSFLMCQNCIFLQYLMLDCTKGHMFIRALAYWGCKTPQMAI